MHDQYDKAGSAAYAVGSRELTSASSRPVALTLSIETVVGEFHRAEPVSVGAGKRRIVGD